MTPAEAQQAVAAGDGRHQDGRMLRTASKARCFVMGLLRYESEGAMIAGQRHGLGEQLEGQAPRVIIGVADVGLVGVGGLACVVEARPGSLHRVPSHTLDMCMETGS
jgi:hypothetical protein